MIALDQSRQVVARQLNLFTEKSDMDTYQDDALRTWRKDLPELTDQEHFVLIRVMSAANIIGKCCDVVKKAIFHGKGLTPEKLAEIARSGKYASDLLSDIGSFDSQEPSDADPMVVDLLRSVIGVFGEAAEFTDLALEMDVDGDNVDITDARLECGDMQYYVAMCANSIGAPLSEIAAENITKLKERYPQGWQS